ncbi:methylitaconate delta2-delta3-isomerase [Seiridium cupressi]
MPEAARKRTRHVTPAVMMRSGTSKGLFFHRSNLPAREADWAAPLLAAMGSSRGDPRQIDGVGGGTSTTSKVAVVSPSQRPGVDVDYTFVQVAVGKDAIDLSGNCGNIASGIGPFALQEGLVKTRPGEKTVDVRIFNTNTSQHLVETLELDEEGNFQEEGKFTLPGVSEPGSEVQVAFLNPQGSMTGSLFPTGRKVDTIHMEASPSLPAFGIQATLIDSANPFVFLDSKMLEPICGGYSSNSLEYLGIIEEIRRAGAVMMGLAPDTRAAAATRGSPKIAIVSNSSRSSNGCDQSIQLADIRVLAFSMGLPHPSLQLTGAVTLGAAVCIPGTVPHAIRSHSLPNVSKYGITLPPTPERTPSPPTFEGNSHQQTSGDAPNVLQESEIEKSILRIEHGKGVIPVEVVMEGGGDKWQVDRFVKEAMTEFLTYKKKTWASFLSVEEARRYNDRCIDACRGCSFAILDYGYVALLPDSAKFGDEICVILGCQEQDTKS